MKIKKNWLLISTIFLITILNCHEVKKQDVIKGTVIYSFTNNMDGTYCLRDKHLITKDSIYRFKTNKFINKEGDLIKSPFDMTESDSIFSLDLTKSINLKKFSELFNQMGNDNIYSKNKDFFIAFDIESKIEFYFDNENRKDLIVNNNSIKHSKRTAHLNHLLTISKSTNFLTSEMRLTKTNTKYLIVNCEQDRAD